MNDWEAAARRTRDARMYELREAGLTWQEVGILGHVSRERARQIVTKEQKIRERPPISEREQAKLAGDLAEFLVDKYGIALVTIAGSEILDALSEVGGVLRKAPR